jgi:hypothetical protein
MLAGSMKLKNFVLLVVLGACAAVAGVYAACGRDHSPPKQTVASERPSPPPAPSAPEQPVAAPPTPTTASDLNARPYDAEVLAWRGRSISSDKQKDVVRGAAYKINVYQDSGSTTVNRAKVDANRNNKWDDKFTFEGEKITLQRSPDDDEKYTETYHWNGAGWTRAK